MRDRYRQGDWNVIDDRTGFKRKASEVKRQWDGLIVGEDQFEERHPQDFVRGRRDVQGVRFTRPEAPDVFVDNVTDPETSTALTFLITQDGDCLVTQSLAYLVTQ